MFLGHGRLLSPLIFVLGKRKGRTKCLRAGHPTCGRQSLTQVRPPIPSPELLLRTQDFHHSWVKLLPRWSRGRSSPSLHKRPRREAGFTFRQENGGGGTRELSCPGRRLPHALVSTRPSAPPCTRLCNGTGARRRKRGFQLRTTCPCQ